MTRTVARAIATAMLAAGLLVAVPGQAMAARSFSTCRAMHKVYPHGVGKPSAYDFTYGTPVTNFKHSLPSIGRTRASTATTTGSPASTTDGLAAVRALVAAGDPQHDDQALRVVDRVDDAEVADSEAPPVAVDERRRAGRPGSIARARMGPRSRAASPGGSLRS